MSSWEMREQTRLNEKAAVDTAAEKVWHSRNRELTVAGVDYFVRSADPGASVRSWDWLGVGCLL
ncbi:MAG: hypothetical protein ACJ72D_11400 [Marmoricola sp.]